MTLLPRYRFGEDGGTKREDVALAIEELWQDLLTTGWTQMWKTCVYNSKLFSKKYKVRRPRPFSATIILSTTDNSSTSTILTLELHMIS